MNTATFKRDGQKPEMEPLKKRRGVTVTTQYGRALTFGISRDRTERIMETMALHKNQGLTATMLKHKAARLKSNPAPGQGNV
jgi:hypothetical protein